ncbi:hypothetical protein KLP28_08650 [Nocardioidaceae bacterium]|nr:hypothetical protein KLP28_08650 [Nocardioidaceae bacterium]
MNHSKLKKRVRDLQSITGMGYQAARAHVLRDGGVTASLESGYELRHFVTPAAIRAWLQVNHPAALDCARGRHFYPPMPIGECVACGVCLTDGYTGDGDEAEVHLSEEEFLEQCVQVNAYYEWAPPLRFLLERGEFDSQAAYRDAARAATPDSAFWSDEDGLDDSRSEPTASATDPWGLQV